MVLEVDVKELDVMASKVRAWDQNNLDLGQVGFNDVKIKIAGGQIPLQLRMPFYVKINAEGIPEFEAVGIDQNFDKIDLELSYMRNDRPSILKSVPEASNRPWSPSSRKMGTVTCNANRSIATASKALTCI